MKMVHAVIRPELLEEVKRLLEKEGFHGLTVYDVRGRGRQDSFSWKVRGNVYKIDLLPKLKIEIVVDDDEAQKVAEIIRSAASTGDIGDGKIFITHVEEAIRIRTGERGPEAVK
ncbi:MAG: P-II family nitrogen regulator [Nitrososphaerota archaeon]|nr:P-II family nitrogen regulator [Candidatus Calditenuaceae archaeon]MDW8073323.1 P-II family nitrogen regulator [Nitrososphaerota archaeon]